MVLQTDNKNFIKFDTELKQYIYYRILTKAELHAHLAEALKRKTSIDTAISEFQAYIDDPRVVEPKELEP